jgi:hypothetical protein
MLTTWLLAIVAALIVALVGVLLKRPRERGMRTARRIRLAMSLRRHEEMQRAIERIAAELAMRRCMDEGNPDDEFRDDWYRWFTGDPDANVDYTRKQQRDRERLDRGDFNVR